MGYLSHRADPSEIKAGDHIYTWRKAFTYAHHGIYIGGNKVIHFTANENESSDSVWNLCSGFPSFTNLSASCLNSLDQEFPQLKIEENCNSIPDSNQNVQSPCLNTHVCGFHQPNSGVILSCLNCFIGTGSLCLYQYGVNKWVYISKIRGGTCTIAQSGPPHEVVHRAESLLQNGFGSYDVARNNCEDFALYCKTSLLINHKATAGRGGSGQVNFMENTINMSVKGIVTSAVERVVWSSVPVGAVTITVGMHCWDRYKTDIGVRKDAVKVNVEDFGSFRGG